jgi:hypothetical protein
MYPFKLHSNDFLVICPKNKPFFAETLKAGKQWRSHQSSYRRGRLNGLFRMGADIFENANNGQKKHNCFTL